MKTIYTHVSTGTKVATDEHGNVFFDGGLGWASFNYRAAEIHTAIANGTFVFDESATHAHKSCEAP